MHYWTDFLHIWTDLKIFGLVWDILGQILYIFILIFANFVHISDGPVSKRPHFSSFFLKGTSIRLVQTNTGLLSLVYTNRVHMTQLMVPGRFGYNIILSKPNVTQLNSTQLKASQKHLP